MKLFRICVVTAVLMAVSNNGFAQSLPAKPDVQDLPFNYVDLKKRQTTQAQKLSNDWMSASEKPYLDEAGRVVYAYGATLPEIVCKPLAICDIKLQAGERIKDAKAGDTSRWKISTATSGSGEGEAPHITIKPVMDGIETSLFITTDKRTYFIALKSSMVDFMPQIGFVYMDDQKDGEPIVDVAAQRAQEIQKANSIVVDGHEVLGKNLDFNYWINGKDSIPWKPVRVFNDGVKTFIDLSHKIDARELPSILVTDSDWRGSMVNYRYVDGRFIVDGLFDTAILVIGTGWSKRKVTIGRGRYEHEYHDEQELNASLRYGDSQ